MAMFLKIFFYAWKCSAVNPDFYGNKFVLLFLVQQNELWDLSDCLCVEIKQYKFMNLSKT